MFLKNIKNRFRNILWTDVRTFGDIKYFNISYAVLIIFPFIVDVLEASNIIVPPTMLLAYLASFLIAIAVLIYQLKCPDDIKRFRVSDEYVQNFQDIFSRAHTDHRINIIKAHLNTDADKGSIEKLDTIKKALDKSTDENQRKELKADYESSIVALHDDAVQRHLINSYNSKNKQVSSYAQISYCLYIVGCTILFLIFLVRSFYVLIF